MKAKCIQTMVTDSNKAYWIKWKPSAFKQCQLIQIKRNESNEIKLHSNKANWINWKQSAFKQSWLIQINLIESNESQMHWNKAKWYI